MWIYEFSYKSGERDWVLAPDIKEAKDFYIGLTGCENLDKCKVTRVPKNRWGSMFIVDPSEIEPNEDEVDYDEDEYSCGMKIIETFAQYAEREKTTDIIATTEY